jgi:hypothetical protein
MNLRKTLTPFILFVAACVAPSFGQVFWSNYSPSGVTDGIWCVTYANGTFAAVTDQGNLLTSTNGLNWSSQAIDPGVWLVSIAYGNGTWVVVGDKGTILVSSDLKTWVNKASGTTNKLNGAFYYQYGFVAVGDGGIVLTSPDGFVVWTIQPWAIPPSGTPNSLYGFAYFSGAINGTNYPSFVVVSGQSGALLWADATASSPYLLLSGWSGTSQDLYAIYNQVNSTDQGYTAVAVGGGGTIIYSNFIFSVSMSGFKWSMGATNPTTTATFKGLTFGNGCFVAVGEQGTIFTSPDGVDWTQRFSGDSPSTVSTATLLSATYSEPLQRFVVTGTGGTILVSNPPPTVFGNVSTRGYVSSTKTFIGGFVIEGTAPRTVLIRADGPVLSTFNVPSPMPDPVLTVYNSSGTVIATNTGWTTNTNPGTISTAAIKVGAFALPNPSPDSALLLTLQPGAYTAQITSAQGNSGIALFEAYTD